MGSSCRERVQSSQTGVRVSAFDVKHHRWSRVRRILLPFMPALVAVAGLVFLTRSDALSMAVTILAWAVVVVAALATWLLSPASHVRVAAKAEEIEELRRKVYCGRHEYRVVDEAEFEKRGLNWGFYARVHDELITLGFRHLNNVIDVTLDQAFPDIIMAIRVYVSQDNTIVAGVYASRSLGALRAMKAFGLISSRGEEALEFETELSDRTFCVTSSAGMAARMTEVPGISRRFQSALRSAAALLTLHRQHIAETLAERGSGIVPRVTATLDEVLEAQQRMLKMKSEFRNQVAFDRVAELERIAGHPLLPAQRQLAEEVQRLHSARVMESERERE
jgi:hypothetical protein